MAAHAGGEAGINLGIVNLGGEAGGEASRSTPRTEAVCAAGIDPQQRRQPSRADRRHAAPGRDQHRRDLDRDSETETTTTRTLENINRSRVLNFVFRQLLQEYYTITYLDDVSLVYSNGYDTSRKRRDPRIARQLPAFGARRRRTGVAVGAQHIYVELCNLTDYTGTRVSFIEKVTEKHGNCIEPEEGQAASQLRRKRRDLKQTYRDKTVNGIILNVTHRVLRTPSVIVDALLGQGEALDCYNQQLQQAAFDGAHLANRKLEQAIAVIDAIADPAEKARLYNHVFGTCCPTPQTATPDADG